MARRPTQQPVPGIAHCMIVSRGQRVKPGVMTSACWTGSCHVPGDQKILFAERVFHLLPDNGHTSVTPCVRKRSKSITPVSRSKSVTSWQLPRLREATEKHVWWILGITRAWTLQISTHTAVFSLPPRAAIRNYESRVVLCIHNVVYLGVVQAQLRPATIRDYWPHYQLTTPIYKCNALYCSLRQLNCCINEFCSNNSGISFSNWIT